MAAVQEAEMQIDALKTAIQKAQGQSCATISAAGGDGARL